MLRRRHLPATPWLLPLLAAALFAGCAPRSPDPAAADPAAGGWRDCRPGFGCATPFPVRFVIVTMFEIGADAGDAPGEFQLWKASQRLDTRVPFPHGHHDLFLNEETGVLGMVTGVGNVKSAAATMALGLDQRFDLSRAYWLVAGIAGIDPEDASIGSVVWSSWLVDGDLAHEIDAREIPEHWETGYFARRTKFPNDPAKPAPRGEVFRTNEALRDWAYGLTRDMALPDSPGLAEARTPYVTHPNAQRPPFVLKGGHIAAQTFWHGALLNAWANDWVRYWTDGATDFVTSAMEETGTYQAITYLHRIGRVDEARFLVLRGGSNYTMPPPGVSAADYLLRENDGFAGLRASLDAIHRVGTRVLDEILGNWDRYERTPPGLDS